MSTRNIASEVVLSNGSVEEHTVYRGRTEHWRVGPWQREQAMGGGPMTEKSLEPWN